MKFNEYLLLERNIVNIKEIEKWIEDFFVHFNQRGDVKKWLRSNLKNYMLRDYPNIVRFNPEIETNYVMHRVENQSWIQKAINRGEELWTVRLPIALENQIFHVLDYFQANPNLNISRMSVPEAIRQSEQWTEQLNKKATEVEDLSGIEEVRKYPDGFRWVKVTSKQALDREGKLMSHCVGSYCSQVSSGSTSIYSLRDKKNEPHCTIELKSGNINQIKGKANGSVDEKYVKYVKDFVLKPIAGEKYSKVSDLRNIGLLEVGGKIYDINNLPKNLNIKGNLDLNGCTGLTSLPAGLKVGGNLDLNGCTGLTSLPAGLKVGGNLDLNGCTGLTSLPAGLKVGGNLDLNGCTGLTSLPAGLKVGGFLDLGGCTSLKSLPEDLKVEAKIYVSISMKKYFENSKFKDQIEV